MSQPCIQQTAFRVHQLAGSEAEQLFFSLRFRCPATKRRANVNKHQHYHVVLLSVFVLAFFLILEWTAPLPAPAPYKSSQSAPSAPVSAPFTDDHAWRLTNAGQE